ncbi:MAG TPA: hypothetical protein VEK56_00445 [Vicinamibacterales bacterium]|nr:hypothetical protein [Vicinamibacterales bacterium]
MAVVFAPSLAIHNGYIYLCDAAVGSGPSSKDSNPGEIFRPKP